MWWLGVCAFCILKDSVHRHVCKSMWIPDVYFSSLPSTALHGNCWGSFYWSTSSGYLVREYLRSFFLWFFKIGATDVLPSLILKVLEIMTEIFMASFNKKSSSWLNRKNFTKRNFSSGSWNCIFRDLIYDF